MNPSWTGANTEMHLSKAWFHLGEGPILKVVGKRNKEEGGGDLDVDILSWLLI